MFRSVLPMHWAVLLCLLWFSCSPSGSRDSRAKAPEGSATVVGRRQESRALALAGSRAPSARSSAEERAQAAESRTRAAEAWRRAPGNDSALGLARAYFPEFSEGTQQEAREAPVNPEAALRVKLPTTEGGDLEIATRGSVFRVSQQGSSTPASRQGKGATFYGARHFWTAVGGHALEESGQWLTQRVEEYVVMEGGGQPFRATYEVTVPEGVGAVRDAGDYLEFLDAGDVPVLRLHHVVARDSAGLSRQGEVKVWGVAAEARRGEGPLPRLVLEGRTLRVAMTVGLEGMEGPVVVDPGWSATGSMATARTHHTTTLLSTGKVLVAGGSSGALDWNSAEVYDPATGTWAGTGSMASIRAYHTATLLPSGKVLVAGGYLGGSYLASAEVYDPETGIWVSAGSMATARYTHTATLLPTGKVLVAGGYNTNSFSLASAELFDPATGTWASTGPMTSGRRDPTATLLPTGKVLVVGGYSGSYLASAEVYDPTTGTWASTGSMASGRDSHTATLLPSSKVLVAGGTNTPTGGILASAEVYDPAMGTWASAGSMTSSRTAHTAVLLPSGKVLVASGAGSSGQLDSAEVYDPATGFWASTNSMSVVRLYSTAVLLPSGKVLLAGGYNYFTGALASAEVYDPGGGRWAATGAMATGRYGHVARLLPSGKVLVAGGTNSSGPLASAEEYDPATGTWASTGSMSTARNNPTATLLLTGKVLVAGGSNTSGYPASAEVYDPATGTWASTGPMATGRYLHTATLLPSGRVLIAGGGNTSASLASAEVYEPATDTWAATGSMATARDNHTATLLPSGKVLVAGGRSSGTSLALAEVYEPATGNWAPTGSMSTPRAFHTATLLPTGKVLVAGGVNTSSLHTSEVYDPARGTWASAASTGAIRDSHTATLLPSGKMLIAGGRFFSTSVATSALYDPGTGTWASTGSLASVRYLHAATLLPSSKVLVTGGSPSGLNTAEVYVDTGALDAWRPVVQTSTLRPGATVNVTGSGFRGVSDASSGNSQSSVSNVPVLSLTAVEGGAVARVPGGRFSDTWVTASVPVVPAGYYILSVITNGIPGGRMVLVSGTPMLPPVVVTPANGATVNTATPVISGTAAVGSTVTVSLDGTVVGTAMVNGSGNWNLTHGTALSQGLHAVTAQATEVSGDTGPSSSASYFRVDTVAPNAPVVVTPASGAFVRTTTPVISGTAEALSTVNVFFDGVMAGTTVASSSRNWSFTPVTALAQGPHTVTAQATDAAGNTSSASSAVSFTVDSVAPAIPGVVTPAAGAVVGTVTPVISGTAEAGSTVTVLIDGTAAGTTVADGAGNWSFTPSSALSQGSHNVTARATDAAGNTSVASNSRPFTVDTVGPAAPLVATPPQGSIINATMPPISGSAESNSTVTITLDGTVAGTTVTNASGIWAWTPTTALSQGLHAATARATDKAGNTGPDSLPRSFTVDTVAPEAPVVVTPASGAFVNSTRPAISGSAEANGTVSVSIDGTAAGTTVANGSGSWNFTPGTALTQGLHSVTARVTDAAGITGPASSAVSFTVDTTAPSVPIVVTPASGAFVNSATPVISGTAEADSTVSVSLDGTVAGTTVTSGSGSWSFTPGTALTQGVHSVTARATDVAGNSGSASSTRSFTVDSVAPGTPVLAGPPDGAFVTTTTPVIAGTAEANSTVTVSLDGTVAGTTVVGSLGKWSYFAGPLAQGPHTVAVRATDIAGNTSPASSTRSFIVDSMAPAIPVVVMPASGAFVSTTTPLISGTAEAHSTVSVWLDGATAGMVLASGSGTWSFMPGTSLTQGLHSVTTWATDAAGNSSPVSSAVSFTVDTVAPAAPVLAAPADGAFVTTATPVLSGTSEAGTTVTVALDGTVAGMVSADGAGTWSFTPVTALTQGPHTVTAQAADVAGNRGILSSPRSFTVDTVAPDAPIVVTPASGAIVSTTTPVISGTAEAGSTVSVALDGTVAGTVVASGAGAWSFTSSTALGQGAHSATAQATDAAGNASAVSSALSFTVDTVAPGAPVVLTPTSGGVVSTARPVISGTAEADTSVTVSLDGAVAGAAPVDGSGNWNFTPSAPLADGPHTATVQAMDAAGNTGPASSALSFTVDTVSPSAPVVVTPASGAFVNTATPGISGTAEADSTVRISLDGVVAGTTFANAVGAWSFAPISPLSEGPHTVMAQAMDAAGNTGPASSARSFTVDTVAPSAPVVLTPASGAFVSTTTPALSGTAEAGSTVKISVDGAVAGTGLADGSGNWSFTPSAPLAEGAHTVTAQAMDAAGNTSPVSSAIAFTVDTIAPSVPVVLMPAQGAAVNTSTPVISGTAEADSTITLSLDGTVVGTTPADDAGSWSFIPSSPLTEGPHTVTAQAFDAGGNLSPVSSARLFTVDTVAPGAPVVLAPANGAFVNTAMPGLFGTAEAGSTVTLFLNGTVVGTAPVDDSGTWSFTPGAELPQGAHTVTAQATDAAGNASPVSGARSFTVDTVAPGAPVLLTPASEAIVSTATPQISGTAEAGSTVTVSVNGTVAEMALADGSGSWSFTPSTALAEGPHTVTATATDAAGNTSSVSNSCVFTVDTGAPSAPVVLMPANGAVVSISTPAISGTAEAGSTVMITLDGTVAGMVRTDGSGAWSFTSGPALTEGPHTVTVQSSDAAGNTSASSNTSFFTVDTVAPTVPIIATPASGTVTNNPRAPISGTAEAHSTLTVFLDGVSMGTTTADSTGAWSFTPEMVLGEGAHTVTITATDAAGNASPVSSPVTWEVDTVGPAQPVVVSPAAGAVVDTRRPTITGTAEVGSTVTVILDGVEVGTESVSETGTWSFTPAVDLAWGRHTLAARGTDAAGNTGPTSVSTPFKISRTITVPVDEGGCSAAPTSAGGWVALVLGIGCLRRRKKPQAA